MQSDNLTPWLEANEPTSIASWPHPLDGSRVPCRLVRFVDCLVTADTGLTYVGHVQPFQKCLVILANGKHDWIRWDAYACQLDRPAGAGGVDASARDRPDRGVGS